MSRTLYSTPQFPRREAAYLNTSNAPEARAGSSQPCPSCGAAVLVPDAMNSDYESEFSPAERDVVDEETVVDWLLDGQERPAAIANDEHCADELPKQKHVHTAQN